MTIEKDLFDIADRIKSISPYYFVVYNQKKGKYELHSHLERPTYVLTFPYDRLDARAVEHTLKTRVENIDRLVKEIEDYNLRLERDAINDGVTKAQSLVETTASRLL